MVVPARTIDKCTRSERTPDTTNHGLIILYCMATAEAANSPYILVGLPVGFARIPLPRLNVLSSFMTHRARLS